MHKMKAYFKDNLKNNQMKKIIYTAILFLCCTMGTYSQANLLSNPGFEIEDSEGGPEGWVNLTPEGGAPEIVTGRVHEGNRSLKINSTGTVLRQGIIQYIAVTPGKQYNLSVWCNVESHGAASSFYLSYTYMDEDGNNLNNGGQITGTNMLSNMVGSSSSYPSSDEALNTWEEITLQTGEPVPEPVAYIVFILRTMRTVTAYIDHASLTEVGASTKQDQTISGLSDLSKTTGDADFELTATASSGLAVSYTSSNPFVATVSGSTVHIVAAGTTSITASQAGNDDYNAAPNAYATLVVTEAPAVKQDQSISGLSDISNTAGDADFNLSAVARSGLAVSYASSNPAVATVSGSTVHIVAAGETNITASQAGNDEYNAAPDVTVKLTVSAGSGIDKVQMQLPVRVVGGQLIVNALSGLRVDVYNAQGIKLQSQIAVSDETVFEGLPSGRVLIVRSGKSAAKVIL
jgi:hypothetical protein